MFALSTSSSVLASSNFAKFYVEEKMRFFVEEREFARGEADDGALILRVYAYICSALFF